MLKSKLLLRTRQTPAVLQTSDGEQNLSFVASMSFSLLICLCSMNIEVRHSWGMTELSPCGVFNMPKVFLFEQCAHHLTCIEHIHQWFQSWAQPVCAQFSYCHNLSWCVSLCIASGIVSLPTCRVPYEPARARPKASKACLSRCEKSLIVCCIPRRRAVRAC